MSTLVGTVEPLPLVGVPRRVRNILGRQSYVAKKTTVMLVDDLDGSQAEEQVTFAVDGHPTAELLQKIGAAPK